MIHLISIIRDTSLLKYVRHQIESINIHDPEMAKLVCQLIPPSCPFAKNVTVFGRTIFEIPPLCKLNPVYEQLMNLRFKALSYLIDEWGEDATAYY